MAWEACQLGAVLLLVCILGVLDYSQRHINVRVVLILPQVGVAQRHCWMGIGKLCADQPKKIMQKTNVSRCLCLLLHNDDDN